MKAIDSLYYPFSIQTKNRFGYPEGLSIDKDKIQIEDLDETTIWERVSIPKSELSLDQLT